MSFFRCNSGGGGSATVEKIYVSGSSWDKTINVDKKMTLIFTCSVYFSSSGDASIYKNGTRVKYVTSSGTDIAETYEANVGDVFRTTGNSRGHMFVYAVY